MQKYRTLDELKAIADEAGVKNTHLKKEQTLLDNLKELDIEVERETDGTVIEYDLAKSDEMQRDGWEVIEVLKQRDKEGRIMRDRPVYHILKPSHNKGD